jgi:hypothetical protein
MTVELRIANEDDAKVWDMIISQSPHGTLFHTWDWLKITEKHTNAKLYPLIAIKDDTNIGVIPLFYQKKGPARMVFSPPPRAALPYLGPVLLGYDTLLQEKWENRYIDFQNSVDNFITYNLKADYISISLPPALQDPRPFTWSGYDIEANYDYRIDLSKGIDNLYKSLDYNKRADIEKANGKGMIVEIGEKKECEKILDLLNIRYVQQGKILTVSNNYFLDIFNTFKDNLKIFTVSIGGEVLTGIICFQHRNSLYGWIGNAKPKKNISPSPNHLLFWEIIRYASESRFNYYTSMSAAGDKRLHSYYAARFNPELRIRYLATKKSFLTGVLENGYTNFLKPLRGTIKNLGFSR